jgi:hypothetical protein
MDIELVMREHPFGASPKSSKHTLYRLKDPFLRFWFRFIDPNRSRLAMGQVDLVEREIQNGWSSFLGDTWEQLAHAAVPTMEIAGNRWMPASRYWGAGLNRLPMELDIVSESIDNDRILIGEVKLSASAVERKSAVSNLKKKAENFPLKGRKKIVPCLFVLNGRRSDKTEPFQIGGKQVLSALR